MALPRRNSQLRRCPVGPLPPSLVSLSGVFPAAGHNGGFQAPPCTVRCAIRDGAFDEHTAGRFGLERALLATLAYVLAVFLAGSEGCVHGRDLHSVSLSLLLSVSSRVLQHMVDALFSMFLRGPHPFPPSQ